MEVRALMSTPVRSILRSDSVARAARLLIDHRVGALPVLEAGEAIGMVSEIDLLGLVAGDVGSPMVREHDPLASEALIRQDLRHFHRVAVVGVDTDPESASWVQLSKLLASGLVVYPVHPEAREIQGLRCARSLLDVPSGIELVQVFPRHGLEVLDVANHALRKHARVFWYEGEALPEAVVDTLRAGGVHVVVGHRLADEIFAAAA